MRRAITSSASSLSSPIKNIAPCTAPAPRATPPSTSPNRPKRPSRSALSYVRSMSFTLLSAFWISRASLSNSLLPISRPFSSDFKASTLLSNSFNDLAAFAFSISISYFNLLMDRLVFVLPNFSIGSRSTLVCRLAVI